VDSLFLESASVNCLVFQSWNNPKAMFALSNAKNSGLGHRGDVISLPHPIQRNAHQGEVWTINSLLMLSPRSGSRNFMKLPKTVTQSHNGEA
jgi:hypothetical protein